VNLTKCIRSTLDRLVWRLRFSRDGNTNKTAHADSISTKLLIVSHDAHIDGAPLLILHVAQIAQREFGMEITTALLGQGPLREDFGQIGPVIDFTKPDWRAMPCAADVKSRTAQLARLRASGYEHALCSTTVSGVLVPLLHECGFKTTVLVHELPALLKRLKMDETAATVARLADQVVFPAPFVRDRFMTLAALDHSRITIRPQGLFRNNPFRDRRDVARSRLEAAPGLGPGGALVVGAGPADHRKGIDIFCQVAVGVLRNDPTARFVWIGDDDKDLARECRSWLAVLGLANKIHFLGLIKDPDTYASYMAGADIFLMTSREDPFPSVVMDAMAAGIPVVGFRDAGGFTDLLEGGAGLLVPFEDRAAMTVAVTSLIRQPEAAKARGSIGRQTIDTRFQFQDYVRDLLCITGIYRPPLPVAESQSAEGRSYAPPHV
jgi:O-antigen biosynthesis protein